MKVTVLTLFPEMIMHGVSDSILKRARQEGLLSVEAINIRGFTENKHNRVDDYPYGGGAGMLMQAQPVFDAYMAAAKGKNVRCIYMTPKGRTFNQAVARELADEEELIFLCGHYEGIDQRVLDEIVTDEISLGDFILTGGELAALTIIDAVSRLVPGVLGNEASPEEESFDRGLLEYPHYTRPEIWHDKRVPEVLLGGAQAEVRRWRLEQAKEITRSRRPDLYEEFVLKEDILSHLKKDKRNAMHVIEPLRRGLAEVEYRVYDPQLGEQLLLYLSVADTFVVYANREDSIREIYELIEELGYPDGEVCESASAYFLANGYHMNYEPVYQAIYTEKVHLKCRGDIEALHKEDLDFLKEHYHSDDSYVEALYKYGRLFGFYEDGVLLGCMGCHFDGSLGALYVKEEARGKGVAIALESFFINRELENGNLPYGQFGESNEACKQLQKKLGLYLSEERIFWMGKEKNG